MKQQTLTGFERFGKTTRRAQLLADMDRIVPWTELTAVVDPPIGALYIVNPIVIAVGSRLKHYWIVARTVETGVSHSFRG
jgi:hypothetical protein